jgi:hypothetical protein
MADLVIQHCGPKVAVVEPVPWTIFFDGSSCGVGSGIGIVLISPQRVSHEFSIPIEKTPTNNQVKYQAVLKEINLYEKLTLKLLRYLEILNS